ncbi:MAG: translation elongation factor Ts, partial [Gammaproteobacteria bacterium]|nr:translation elongation factor Ts [Gammaproteobacteria bacterium]
NRIGVLIEVKDGDEVLNKDLAMHVAASKPAYVNADSVPQSVIESERAIFHAQAEQSGKPADIITKMVDGRIRKYLGEITLLGQPFIKDTDVSVEKLLKQHGAEVVDFLRYEVGEGIDKKEENFAEEVAAQARGH